MTYVFNFDSSALFLLLRQQLSHLALLDLDGIASLVHEHAKPLARHLQMSLHLSLLVAEDEVRCTRLELIHRRHGCE